MEEIYYKGYLIRPTPHQLRDTGKWTTDLYISRHTDRDVKEKHFVAANTFYTKEEAIQHCVDFGRQIINGEHEHSTVPGAQLNMTNMDIQMNPRLLGIPVLHIDANLINARQKIHNINQLERWNRDGVVTINISSTAHAEAKAGGNKKRTDKANEQIYTTMPPANTSDPFYQKIEVAIFPNGAKNDNQRNDVKIVFKAAKSEAILVTGDGGSNRQPGGILGNRHKLRGIVKILSPEEAVSCIMKKIRNRDELNMQIHQKFGLELPAWTGLD